MKTVRTSSLPLARLALCCSLLLTIPSCLSLPNQISDDFAKKLSEEMRKLFAEGELEFVAACHEVIDQSSNEPWSDYKRSLMRSQQVCVSYPRKVFPETHPDGVSLIEMTNVVPIDKRLLREPVGREMRQGDSKDTVQCTTLLARQRSDTSQQVTGEYLATIEYAREHSGKVEYQFVTLRVEGVFDEAAKTWKISAPMVKK